LPAKAAPAEVTLQVTLTIINLARALGHRHCLGDSRGESAVTRRHGITRAVGVTLRLATDT